MAGGMPRRLHRHTAGAGRGRRDARQVAVAFGLRGRQAGPLPTALGTVQPAGRTVDLKITGILAITDGLIGAVQMAADNLDLLLQLGAVTPGGTVAIDAWLTSNHEAGTADSRTG